jgi:signal transduction histidine kinase
MLTVLRWGTLSLALALSLIEHDGQRAALAGGVLVAYTLWRTVRPVGYGHSAWKVSAALLLEVAVGVAVVEATGFGRSPFLIFLGVAAVLAGFTGGLPVVAGVAGMAGLAVALPTVLLVSERSVADTSIQFAIELVLVGVVGGFSRYLVEEARQAREGVVAQADHLAEVNELLFDLHRATEHEATPLHLDGAARWALERLEETFAPDVAAVVLVDAATSAWYIAAGAGVRLTEAGRTLELPPALGRATSAHEPVVLEHLDQGLSYRSRWGLYCPMRARDQLVGIVAVETEDLRRTTPVDRRHMSDVARAAALALDNARWLERIHTLGVEHERTRLARELHDHIGQSVVYLGFELDRLVQMSGGRAVQRDLLSLRGDVRNLVEELRDMLVDLRCDVSETRDVESVLASLLDRVNRRRRVTVTLTSDVAARLPLPVEREFWRVAREAVMNAERHSRASMVSVLWACSPEGAVLEVSDDGVGLPAGKAAGVSGYGLLGMRERADSVGAQLEITSGPDKGTTVRMRMKAA